MSSDDRRARKRERTTSLITKTAFALFEAHGYEAVTMERIAAQADVARATLYNHFPVKDAVLVHGLHARLARDLGALAQQVLARRAFVSRVAVLLDASAGFWKDHRQYAAPYVRHRFGQVGDGNAGQAASDMVTVYVQLIEHAQAQGELDASLPPARLAGHLHALYLSALLAWIADPALDLADELAAGLEFFMRAAARTG